MTKPYIKRLKGNWRQGKDYKGDAEERRYAKEEIKQALAEADEDFKYRYQGNNVTNLKKLAKMKLARLEYRVRYYEQQLLSKTWLGTNFANYLRAELKKAKKQLEAQKEAENHKGRK